MSNTDRFAAEWQDAPAPGKVVPLRKGEELSEDRLALEFERRHAGELRYCHTAGSWYVWDGARWKQERTQLAFTWAREVCRDISGGDAKFSKANTASAVERFAAAARAFAVTAEHWDQAPLLLGTPGGTVELTTGKLRPASQGDMITRAAAATPDSKGHPRRWLAFLREATRDDAELMRFLQQIAGYGLSGDTSEHALFFIYGAGGNGKSVWLNTMTGILGEYATTAAMETFAASKHDKHPADLAMLKGARLVTASETEDGRTWAEAKIKQMTGGDPVTARFMRRDFFTYQPEFKLVIVGNHKPRLNNVDDATRRRFNIIPFIHKPSAPDPGLEADLRKEWPQILRWMIEGFLDWQEHGLIRPDSVRLATDEYFEDQDVFGQWLDECCDLGGIHAGSNARLFASWRRYAEAAGEDAGSAKSFSQALRKRGFEPYRKANERGFKGVDVTPPATDESPRYGF